MTTSPLGPSPGDRAAGRPAPGRVAPDASPAIAPDEVRIRVDRLNLDAASYRQIREAYVRPGKIRQGRARDHHHPGEMQNPVTGSGGMLTGTVERSRPNSPLRPHTGRAHRHPVSPHPDPPSDH